MIPLGDLREDGLFDKPSFLRNILMYFSAWKSLFFAHFLTGASKDQGEREAEADKAGSSRCPWTTEGRWGLRTCKGNFLVDAFFFFFKRKKAYSGRYTPHSQSVGHLGRRERPVDAF